MSNPNRPLGIFAYHLHKLSTNQFLRVNGKQPIFLQMRTELLRGEVLVSNK